MSESLFLLRNGAAPTKMNSSDFETEDSFQALLAKFPELLTDADFGENTPRRWMLISRETAVSDRDGGLVRWSLDHLFLDQDGVPTLVEVKRAVDTRGRREVVAQMLDYAANAVRWWKVDDLAKLFEQNCEKEGASPQDQISKLLEIELPDTEAFWRGVQANLTSGRIRMIFVADRIAPELQRIVEFLNEQMKSATVVALELRSFASGSDRILSPRLIGVTSQAAANKNVVTAVGSPAEWQLMVLSAHKEQVARFVDLLTELGATPKVAGQSLAMEFSAAAKPIRVAYVRANGRVAISGWMLAKAEEFQTESSRLELYGQFEKIGFKLSHKGPSGEPLFDLPDIADENGWRKLKEFFAMLVGKLASA
jgi:hypothetical protein